MTGIKPSFVYLDQNHWIYLARDYWGRTDRPAHRGLAKRVLAAVRSRELILPLSTLHFIEHLRAESEGRRRRLAEVFDLFSDGWYMASWSCVLRAEIDRAIRRLCDEALTPPEPGVFGKGFLFGLGPKEKELVLRGRSEQQLDVLGLVAALPGAVFDLLTFPNEAGRKHMVDRVTDAGAAYAVAVEERRSAGKEATPNTPRRIVYAQYTSMHQDLVLAALAKRGRSAAQFLRMGCEGLSAFWSDVPSLDVDCELRLYRDRQWTRDVDPNDVRDIAYLALAIPYCDIVLTERFWAHAAQVTGLAEKYGTTVCTDLGDLMEYVTLG